MPNRPTQYNRSTELTRTRIATIRRQDEALRLRRQGLPYIEIARQLGFTPNGVPRPQSAAEAVRAAERREALRNSEVAVATVTAEEPVTIPAIPSQRTFGFEAEFFGITPSVAVQALTAVGLVAQSERWNHETRPHWKVTTDGSVTGRGTGCGTGLELVSPILQGEQGIADAAKAVKALLDAGAKVDKTCGLHVHLGMDGLTGADIMKVVDYYTANGNLVDSMLATSRHNSRWAQKYSQRALLGDFNGFRTLTSNNEMRVATRGYDRYRTVNLTAYGKYGTIEFRQHQGTLNPEKVTSWVKFVMALTEKAVTLSDAYATATDLPTLLGELSLTDETRSFLIRRAERLSASR